MNTSQIEIKEPSLEDYITKENDTFFLDLTDLHEPTIQGITYEQGDKIRWKWEGKKYIGVIQQFGHLPGMFVLKIHNET